MQRAERSQECLTAIAPATLRSNHLHRRAFHETARRKSGQDAVRTKLEACPHAFGFQHMHAVEEAHGLAHLTHPVLRAAELVLRRQVPRYITDDRQTGCVEGDLGQHLAEGLQHRLHALRVEGVADLQAAGPAAFGLELFGQCQHGRFIA